MITIFINQFNAFRKYSLRNEADSLLLISICFSTSLLAMRMIATKSIYYVFLEWNLFLALIPYLLSSFLYRRINSGLNNYVLAAISFVWLLFIPNTFYILTDLFHLGETGAAPLWFDLLLILSFAWNGLMLGILSIRQMEKIFHLKFSTRNELLFLYPIMWLNALGVFIGRYLRFNSWDIITSPFRLTLDILDLLMHPFAHKNAFAMVMTYSIFMTLIYLTLKKQRTEDRGQLTVDS
jgi:uncharacterized membrane protein